jgi:hypothetical protein
LVVAEVLLSGMKVAQQTQTVWLAVLVEALVMLILVLILEGLAQLGKATQVVMLQVMDLHFQVVVAEVLELLVLMVEVLVL